MDGLRVLLLNRLLVCGCGVWQELGSISPALGRAGGTVSCGQGELREGAWKCYL